MYLVGKECSVLRFVQNQEPEHVTPSKSGKWSLEAAPEHPSAFDSEL